jgi:hypothetical protein
MGMDPKVAESPHEDLGKQRFLLSHPMTRVGGQGGPPPSPPIGHRLVRLQARGPSSVSVSVEKVEPATWREPGRQYSGSVMQLTASLTPRPSTARDRNNSARNRSSSLRRASAPSWSRSTPTHARLMARRGLLSVTCLSTLQPAKVLNTFRGSSVRALAYKARGRGYPSPLSTHSPGRPGLRSRKRTSGLVAPL